MLRQALRSRTLEDVVGADAPPAHMRMTLLDGGAVLEGGPAVRGPGEFPHVLVSGHLLDAQALAESPGIPEVGYEQDHRPQERSLLAGRQRVKVSQEARQPFEGGQRQVRSSRSEEHTSELQSLRHL